jgi:lipoprotein-releasing system permease protein
MDKKILKFKFWLYLSFKNFKFHNKNINIIFLSLFLGISSGLMVLIVVIGIMNGFQENHISRRIEIGSYHITISKSNNEPISLSESNEIKKNILNDIKDIEAIIPFADKEVIVRFQDGLYSNDQILKLRAIDPEGAKNDTRFMKFFHLNYGNFNLNTADDNIILGEVLFDYFFGNINSNIYLTPDISLKSFNNTGIPFKVVNTFKTDSYDYDRFWGFISIYSLRNLNGNILCDAIGIKLDDKKKVHSVIKILKEKLPDSFKLQTAEEINMGYFTALKLEKFMIILLFTLIFLMVASNTYGAIKLNIIQKKKDISILKAYGATPRDIVISFIIEGIILNFTGCFFGILLGFLIVYNIENIFHITEFLINCIYSYIVILFSNIIPGLKFSPVVLYDNSIYYQTGFPVKIILSEIITICFFISSITLLASFIPARKSAALKPKEILKK